MKYKLAIFDFDGTLADSFEWFCRAVALAARRYRFRLADASEVETLRGLDAYAIAKQLDIAAWKMPLIARFMRRHMAEELHTIELFPGIAAALQELHASGVRLAVVTSNALPNVRHVLGSELCSLFDHYGCGASLFGKRPKLRAVLRARGVSPEEAIYVGDELRDLVAARDERIAFGAVAWGYTRLSGFHPEELAEVFARPQDIADSLVRQGRGDR